MNARWAAVVYRASVLYNFELEKKNKKNHLVLQMNKKALKK